jgi:N-acetylglucosaminyldiphosphoundecaprenol N-acetyl-beta-D-mannosaminyltransferase
VPLAERISGVDLILPLMKLGAERRWRVYLLGAGPGTAEAAARVIRGKYPVDIVGIESPMISIQAGAEQNDPIVRRIREAKPDLMLVALGSPKQEIWIHQVAEQLRPTVAIGIGAGLDFISGRVPRAPRWMSKSGLEWFYRLTQEPKRLWRRYLVNDPRFAGIFLRTLRAQRGK